MPLSTRQRMLTTPAGQLVEAGLQQIVGYQIAQAAITTDAIFHQQVAEALNLRRVEYTILMLIRENPACTSGRLVRALNVTAPNITMWIDKLEERGLVKRAQSTTDRRANHLALTADGEALAQNATRRLAEAEMQALSAALSGAERAMLLELLHKVALCRRG
ncbi:MarR family transcriptional regulator [Ideonella sp.]|uniref:MarR family winged helix-turn-helix transcriptional regulator n=1 Tax=Ideonella sp. TaxID=1929293 RepID=UPI002B460DE4|nr:MarR family transcriptional regulator [Ideonella sp.]HJV67668.1 MarR family transcriptional regulator [Ideonella sp.]